MVGRCSGAKVHTGGVTPSLSRTGPRFGLPPSPNAGPARPRLLVGVAAPGGAVLHTVRPVCSAWGSPAGVCRVLVGRGLIDRLVDHAPFRLVGEMPASVHGDLLSLIFSLASLRLEVKDQAYIATYLPTVRAAPDPPSPEAFPPGSAQQPER